VLFSDVSAQVRAEEALAAGHLRFQRLSAALERLSQADGCEPLQHELLRSAQQLAAADGVAVVLDGGQAFHCDGRSTPEGAVWNSGPHPLIVAVAESAMQNRQTAVVDDVAADPRMPEGLTDDAFIRSIVMVPVGGSRHAGAVGAYWSGPHRPDPEELAVLEVLARAAGTALDRQLATDRLRESEERFRVLIEETAQAVWETDENGAVVELSPSWEAYTGQSFEEMAGSGWLDATHSDDRDHAEHEWRMALAHRRPMNAEFRIWRATGECRWTNVRAVPLFDADGAIRKWIGMNIDITERKRAEQRVREAALHDPLTGLPNRRLIFEYAGHLLAAAGRKHSQGAMLFVDLDRFKPINDLYGHETGDLLLQEVGRRLLACVRKEDLVGRLGGDEFVIMLPYLEQMHDALSIAENVVRSVSAPFSIENKDLSVSPSIGISFFPQHGMEVDALIRTADLAMYHAKQRGRAAYSVYAPELEPRGDPAWSVEEKLKRALAGDGEGLVLHYQPVVDMQTGRLTGAEALLRLSAEEDHAIGPDLFIPVAESTGLIGAVGEWVAAEACRQHLAWLSQGLPAVPITINISPQQFRLRRFAQRLSDIVLESGIDPGCLQLDVTESTVMENVPQAIEILNAIRATGMKVALDDFGTGYSSLGSLGSLPIDKLKIGQSFVRHLDEDQASRAVAEAIITLGKSLCLEVVGEGIESDQSHAYLQAHGCDQGQGYFVGRPMPNDEFVHWYSRNSRQPPVH
jgi:diguanylate cyclase (GGDEF)-like protein/PAS domain S-box-containing protein